jgi:hypothetical protein
VYSLAALKLGIKAPVAASNDKPTGVKEKVPPAIEPEPVIDGRTSEVKLLQNEPPA